MKSFGNEEAAHREWKGFSFIFVGKTKKYKPIAAKKVALGMYLIAQHGSQGIHIYSYSDIAKYIKRYDSII